MEVIDRVGRILDQDVERNLGRSGRAAQGMAVIGLLQKVGVPEHGTGTATVDDVDRLVDDLLKERGECACEAVVVAARVEGHDHVDRSAREARLGAQDRRSGECRRNHTPRGEFEHGSARERCFHRDLFLRMFV